MIQRILKPIKSHSFFLFGARGTGKTTLLKHILPPSKTLTFDLLDPEIEDRFARNPSELREILKASSNKIEWVFIDEIQKLPKLLNIVHKEIEESRFRYSKGRECRHKDRTILFSDIRRHTHRLHPRTLSHVYPQTPTYES